MDLKLHIGRRLKAARNSAGLTQARLAEVVDRAVESISNLERGQSLPSLELLVAISQATSKPILYFLEGFDHDRKVSASRALLEEQARQLVSNLTDSELALSIKVMTAIKS